MNHVRGILDKYYSLPFKWRWAWLSAILITAIQVGQRYTDHLVSERNYDFSWIPVFSSFFINYMVWVLWLPALYRWVNWFRKTPYRWVTAVSTGILIAAIHRTLVSRLVDLSNYFRYGYLRDFLGANSVLEISVGVFNSALALMAIVLIFLAFDYQQRYLSQQRLRAQAQLHALRMQLNPHFLFNTLHSISALIDIDYKKAQQMLSKLGSLLRKVLDEEDQQLVPLREEIDFIREYLDIEQIRFDHLRVNLSIGDTTDDALVPHLILQPLVENAVKHGSSNLNTAITQIAIKTEQITFNEKKGLQLTVENQIDPDNDNTIKGLGIGLINIRKRLEELYKTFELETFRRKDQTFVARIAIPFQV